MECVIYYLRSRESVSIFVVSIPIRIRDVRGSILHRQAGCPACWISWSFAVSAKYWEFILK